MAILDNDRRSYAARYGHHDEGDEREERRGPGHDRDRDEFGRRRDGRDQGGGRGWVSEEHRWRVRPHDHDERRGDLESGRDWESGRDGYGGRDDDDDGRARDEHGGARHGTSRSGSGTRYRDRDVERDFDDHGGSDGHGWYGGEHSWYGGEHSGSGRGAGYRTGSAGRGSFRHGAEAMGMAAGLERGHEGRRHDRTGYDRTGHDMIGKGPKGYTRPDDRIREDVCDGLTDDPYLDASSIEVQVRNGEVTLSGSVDGRAAKRHAEDLAERASGVKNVQNTLRIQA